MLGRADKRRRDERAQDEQQNALPVPSPQFRRRAWWAFQRALDPLAPPKPLPTRAPRPR